MTTPIDVALSAHHLGEEDMPKLKEWYKKSVERLRMAYKHKVKVAFGADIVSKVSNLSRGEATLLFIDSFKDANASPLQIIQAMTINAAEALNKHKKIGLIKEGYLANLVAVAKNPLQDIDQLKQVSFVMKRGVVYKNEQ